MSVGAVLGGALQGIGIGMMQQTKQRDEERRDAALAALRRQENAENNAMVADREAKGDQRRSSAQMALQDDSQAFAAATGSAAAEAQSREKEADRKHEINLQTLRGRQSLDQAIATENARAKNDGDMIAETHVDETTGAIMGVRKNGSHFIMSGVIARKLPRSSASGSSSLFTEPEAAAAPVKPIAPDFVYDAKTGKLVPNTAKGS